MLIEREDEFYRGMLGGLVAGLVMLGISELFRHFKVIKYGILFFAGETVFKFTHTPGMIALAVLIHLGISIFWGVLMTFILSTLTNRLYYFKNAFMSFCIFFFHFGILDEPFHYPREYHQHTMDMVIILLSYVIFGLILGFMVRNRSISFLLKWDKY